MEFIYRLFSSLYGDNLHDYLDGYDCAQADFVHSSMFASIGIVALIIAAIFFVLYYYVINSSKWSKWWHWIIVALIVGVINFIIGYEWTSGELAEIGDCLRYYVDSEENIHKDIEMITNVEFWMFGLANCFVSAIFFMILSFAGKWKSTNCCRTPF